jgi:lantibiotic modifying enzyme
MYPANISAEGLLGTTCPTQTSHTDSADSVRHRFVRAAEHIAEVIRQAARPARSGSVLWPVEPPYCAWEWEPGNKQLRYDLYGGICGIALFLAALDAVRVSAEYRGLINQALLPIQRLSSRRLDQWLAIEPAGAGVGSLSIIYSLHGIATFTQNDELACLALRAARSLSLKKICSGRALDLVAGAAGAILVWLKLYRSSADSSLLEKAGECGWHLLRNRAITSSGLRAWETSPGKCQAGYAHGAAGITHALSVLFQLTGETEFKNAAAEAIAYENTLYSEAAGNWPHILNVREGGEFEYWNSWCNGAPGIGLGRLGCFGALGKELLAQDVERALQANARSGARAHIDTPCCGTLGRLELFVEASLRLEDIQYRRAATALADAVVSRAARKGSYGFGARGELPLTFHKGLAGIGYQMLRAAMPEQVPSILSWA